MNYPARTRTYTLVLLALIGAAPLTGRAAADPTAIETRVQALEEKLLQITQENALLKKQLGLDGKTPPTFVTAAGKEAKLSLGGYLQGQAEFGDAPDSRFSSERDRFYVRRARLTAKGSFAEDFGFTLQGDIGSNTLGESSGRSMQASDVFVVWTKYEAANVQLGQFKTPFGYEQLMADTKGLAIERSLPNDRLTLSRQIGAMVSGAVLDKRLNYAAGAFNGNGINTSANDNDQFLYVGRVAGTAVETKSLRLNLGTGAFTTRDTGAFTGRRTGYAFDAQAKFGGAEIDAEYIHTRSNRDVGADFSSSGWSVLGAYFVVPKTLQAVVRYETYDPSNSASADDTDVWTAGFNYLIKGDDLKLSVNYLLGDTAGRDDNTGRLITRMQVVF